MKYIDIGGYVTPKHCIYGPRPAEGLVLNNYEWWSITDHLIKDQRERELAAVLRAKENAKKDLSLQITSNWSDTMANLKAQGILKREEKKEKEKQDRIDQYNAILKEREEKRKKLMKEARRVIFEQSDAAKTLTSALHHAMILEEWRKQIEMQDLIKARELKNQQEWTKKVIEDNKRETCREMLEKKSKKDNLKEDIHNQIVELQNRRREEERAEFEALQEDAKRMVLEGEKIAHCNMVELEYRKKFGQKFMKKSKFQIQHEKNLALEEEEENEINKIYKDYEEKFQKERKEREEKMKNEAIERRQKITEMLAQKMREAAEREAEFVNAAIKEKESQANREDEEKKEKHRKHIEDLLEGLRKAKEKRERDMLEMKEAQKWAVIQNYAKAEINQQLQQSSEIARKKMLKENREFYDRQIQEKKEQMEQDIKDMMSELPNESAEKEELENYIKEVLDFAKENNLPLQPINEVASNLRDEYHLENKEKQDMINERNQMMAQQGQRRKSKPLGYGCYCLKY